MHALDTPTHTHAPGGVLVCVWVWGFLVGSGLTSQQHLLQQVVYLGHAEELDELDLLDHLPGDALQRGQQQQQLPEAAARVVLPVVDVVLQAHLHLVPHALDLHRVAQTLGV